jgi:hypothetical protein
MSQRLNTIQTLLSSLSSLSDSAQQEIKDKLVICDSNTWHDLTRLELDNSIVDIEEDGHVWYRDDDLRDCGYIHESDILDYLDISEIDKHLAKSNDYRLNIDVIEKLYKSRARLVDADYVLTQDEDALIKAMLDDEGLDYE